MNETYRQLKPNGLWTFFKPAFPDAAIAIFGALCAAFLVSSASLSDSALATVFLTLAALTPPHMLLIECRRDKFEKRHGYYKLDSQRAP